MASRTDEVVSVPVDANAGIGESFVATVERNVVIDLSLVVFYKLLDPSKVCFFFHRKNKNQIALSLDSCRIERANCRQQGFDVSRVIADARRVHSASRTVA